MNIVDFSKSPSLITHYLDQLRDVEVQKDRMRFRKNLTRISWLMAYEISKDLGYKSKVVTTPLGDSNSAILEDQPVIAFVLRAGLAMHTGFLDMFDGADNCFISAYREEGSKENIKVHIEYLASPDLSGRTVILVDPMLATGKSLIGAIEALKQNGLPKDIHVACIVAAPQGIEQVQQSKHKVKKLWLGAIDKGLDNRAYIIPGLGDAGDLAFGDKL